MLAEVDFDADVLHLIAGDHAALEPLLESLFDGRQKVVGNRAADDRIDPQEIVLRVVVKLLASKGSAPWCRISRDRCRAEAGTCGCALRRTGRGRPIASCGDSFPRPWPESFRDRESSAPWCRLRLCRAVLSRSRIICRCSSLMPVITSSLVCGSRSSWNVGSSSTILCSAPESLPSSPRLLGVTARPTIGVGNLIGGSVRSPSDRAGVQVFGLGHGHDVAGPGRVDRRASRSLAPRAAGPS